MKIIWAILVVGIVLRMILSYVTFHSDMLAFKLGGEVIASGKILNLYDYSDEKIAILNYPPAVYWFHGIFNFLLGNILGVGLLVKTPYLIFDLLIGLLFLKLLPVRKESILAFTLWMFNPVSIYATYMMGQFDIIPTFFTILSIYLITKHKLNLAALALGGGIAFKIYPIFLLIPLLILGKNLKEKLGLVILAIMPYLLSILPYISSSSFRATALFTNQSFKSLYANVPVSGGESILLFPALLLLFYLYIQSKSLDKLSFWKIYLIPLLLFFIFTHFHPQWLIWVTPFLILDLVTHKFKNLLSVLLIFLSWMGMLFFFDPGLNVGLFAPLWSQLHSMPSVWTVLNLNIDHNLARSILQTIFVGSSAYLIYQYFPRKNNV